MRQRTLQQDGSMVQTVTASLPYSVMYLLIVSLPFLGSAFAGAFGRLIGTEGTAIVTTTSVALSFCFSVTAWYEVAMGSSCYLRIAPWICEEMFDAYWGFLFDSLTVVMLMVVTFVSSLVHIYAISYMSEDPHSPRFLCYLSIFTSLMLLLVTGDNLIQLFLGWEGVGIASYLLINFWYHRMQADKAAIKAMLVNRVGDFGLAIGIFGCFNLLQTVDFSTICASAAFAAEPTYSVLFCNQRVHAITVMGLFLFIGAINYGSPSRLSS